MMSSLAKPSDQARLQLVKRLNDELHGTSDPYTQSMEMFIDWLGRIGFGIPDSRFLQTMILRSSGALGLRSISIILLDENNTAINFSSSGYPTEAAKLLDAYTTMEERLPSVDAMLTGKAVILRSRTEIEEYGVYLRAWVSYIPWINSLMAFPLMSNGSLIGSVVWGFDDDKTSKDREVRLFLGLSMIIQSMIPDAFKGFDHKSSGARIETPATPITSDRVSLETQYRMSARQLAIARMIADGATNREIAKALYFSESTARYETIKIYERLQVKNRAQAAALIRSLI
jgi:DNA-binding CsgD family transcriptional regulator